MKYSGILSGDLLAGFNELTPQKGRPMEKYFLWQEILASVSIKEHAEELYALWSELFSNEALPLAWVPSDPLHTNVVTFMRALNIDNYPALYDWSVNNRGEFWSRTIEKLGIKFQKKPDSILDTTKGIEDPEWLKGASMNIAESCFQQDSHVTAIVQGSEEGPVQRLTYGDLHTLVNRIANGLVKLGLKPGDTIVLYLPFTLESIAAYLATVKAGMASVSVADSFSPAELKKRIEITKAKAILTCDGYMYGGKGIDVFSKVKEADAPRAIVCNYLNKVSLRSEKNDILFEEFLGGEKFNTWYTEPAATTNILFSSGTTKEPKAIPWTHLTPIKCAADGYFHQDIRNGDVVTWTTGMGWMMAPWLIYASLINKATMAIFTGAATSEKFGHFVNEAGVTMLGTIPSVVKAWRAQKFHEKFSWNNINVFSSTGEPSNQEDYFYLMLLAGGKAPVIEYCGGTEIGGGYITGSVMQPASPATFTTPALGMSFYLLNGQHEQVDEEEQGEVFIVPPSIGLTQKLLNRDHHEEYYANMPIGPKGEVLRKHGDAFEVVTMLGTTFYKSIGRVDDAMNLGGIKVSAVEIEEMLNKHAMIMETAAISVPGEGGGPERLIVFYKPSAQVADKDALKKELQNLITKELNPLFRISEIVEKQVLPRTASNKLMRRELRKEYMGK